MTDLFAPLVDLRVGDAILIDINPDHVAMARERVGS